MVKETIPRNMKSQYRIEPFTPKYLEPAVELFIRNYRDEQEKNPLLPSRANDEPAINDYSSSTRQPTISEEISGGNI